MFTFATPLYFGLLLPLAAAAWWVYRPAIRRGMLFSRAHACALHGQSIRQRAARLFPALILLGMAACVVALARPRTMLSRTHRTADVIAIQMVVDVSGSMEALDMSEIAGNRIIRARTRLDVVKETFGEFIRKRPDDLIGLVTFGGYATTRSPLTSDHEALLHVLGGVQIPKPSDGTTGPLLDQQELMTAIGDALATACARLRDAEPVSKIILLLSDGESNAGIIQPEAAIQAARQLGFKVYTIGVGSTGEAPFIERNRFGQEAVVMRNVAMDEALLKRIAAETGGRYFHVRDPRGLQEAMENIDTLEKTRVEREVFEQYEELFPVALGPGLLLVALGAGLNMLGTRRLL